MRIILNIYGKEAGWHAVHGFTDTTTRTRIKLKAVPFYEKQDLHFPCSVNEPRHDISNNVVCATSKASDQPAHTRSLIRAFASRLTYYEC